MLIIKYDSKYTSLFQQLDSLYLVFYRTQRFVILLLHHFPNTFLFFTPKVKFIQLILYRHLVPSPLLFVDYLHTPTSGSRLNFYGSTGVFYKQILGTFTKVSGSLLFYFFSLSIFNPESTLSYSTRWILILFFFLFLDFVSLVTLSSVGPLILLCFFPSIFLFHWVVVIMTILHQIPLLSLYIT